MVWSFCGKIKLPDIIVFKRRRAEDGNQSGAGFKATGCLRRRCSFHVCWVWTGAGTTCEFSASALIIPPYQHVWHLQLPSVQLSPVRRDSLFVSSSAPVISFRGGLFLHLSPQCWLSLWGINRWLTDSMCLCVYLHWSNDGEGLRSEALEMLFYLCCRGTIIAETKENQTGFVPVTRVPPSRWTISEGSVCRCMSLSLESPASSEKGLSGTVCVRYQTVADKPGTRFISAGCTVDLWAVHRSLSRWTAFF